ncbi:MAG: glutathione transferase [Anaeromyxobacteraceae bacterium]
MADAKLVLYAESRFESPYVFSCWVVLREKGIPFDVETMSLQAGEHRKGDYAARSVTGRVPALRHGDFWLSESSAIDEYLEEVFPPPAHARLYPADPRDRARARQIQAWVRSDLMPIREERPTSSVFSGSPVKPLSSDARSAAERLLAGADALVPSGDGFLFGAFGIADADLAMMLMRLVANGDPVPAKVAAYARRVWERPSVKSWVERKR